MKLHRCVQGSPEWHRLRAGRPTASKFYLMRESARLKSGPDAGDYSSEAKDLAFQYAIERIGGEPLDEGFEVWSAARGHRLEPDARRAHEDEAGVIVEQVGFITTDDGLFGASLDGVIGDEGRSEYKCFISPTKLRKIIIHWDTQLVMDQCQGGLWISEGEWIDFCLYCPALASAGKDLVRFRIFRDDDYIEALERDVWEFKLLVDAYEAKLRAPLPAPEVLSLKQQYRRIKTEWPPRAPKSAIEAAQVVLEPPAAAAPAELSEFEQFAKRVRLAANEIAAELVLDAASHLPAEQILELREIARTTFATA